MNTLETIHSRRSIRRFTAQPITDEQLHTLLDAAMTAPVRAMLKPGNSSSCARRKDARV